MSAFPQAFSFSFAFTVAFRSFEGALAFAEGFAGAVGASVLRHFMLILFLRVFQLQHTVVSPPLLRLQLLEFYKVVAVFIIRGRHCKNGRDYSGQGQDVVRRP